MSIHFRKQHRLLLSRQAQVQLRPLCCRHVKKQHRPLWYRQVQVQLRPLCGVDTSRCNTGLYSVDKSRCSSGPCGVDTSRYSAGLCSVDSTGEETSRSSSGSCGNALYNVISIKTSFYQSKTNQLIKKYRSETNCFISKLTLANQNKLAYTKTRH
jgi:hypothetical protein